MSKDQIEFNILFRKPIYPLVVISADKLMAAYNIKELATCCITALPVDERGIIKAIDSSGEEFWYSTKNCAIAPGFAAKRWTKKRMIETFNNSTNAKESKQEYSTKGLSGKRLGKIIGDICQMLGT